MDLPVRIQIRFTLQSFPREAEKKKTAYNLFPAKRRTKKQPAIFSPPRREQKNSLQSFPRAAGNKKTACNPFPASSGENIHTKIPSRWDREGIVPNIRYRQRKETGVITNSRVYPCG